MNDIIFYVLIIWIIFIGFIIIIIMFKKIKFNVLQISNPNCLKHFRILNKHVIICRILFKHLYRYSSTWMNTVVTDGSCSLTHKHISPTFSLGETYSFQKLNIRTKINCRYLWQNEKLIKYENNIYMIKKLTRKFFTPCSVRLLICLTVIFLCIFLKINTYFLMQVINPVWNLSIFDANQF